MKAVFIKQCYGEDSKLYRLEGDGAPRYVVVSAAVVESGLGGGPETYIFPADAAGNIVSWSHLKGSFRGGLDHTRALRGHGCTEVVYEGEEEP